MLKNNRRRFEGQVGQRGIMFRSPERADVGVEKKTGIEELEEGWSQRGGIKLRIIRRTSFSLRRELGKKEVSCSCFAVNSQFG